MANSTYILQIFVMELVLLSHIHGVKSYIRGPPGDTEYRSDTTTRLSYLTVLELLAPEKKITAQETQASASRPNLPRRHLQTYEELEEQVTTRPISHNLQDLYRMMDSFESHDPQNIAHKTQNSPQEDYIVKLISITLQALQNEFLSIHERMWSLTLLDALQSYLPCEKLIGIRTNVAEGPVFRGALELHLTRGLDIDLLSISQEILLDPCTQRERQHGKY
ncbi:hypothetical protein DFH28DRAFT_611091 [Melampsora americana]|nr:hypothetical protein DFH28DRAFT_611091 [Melampsora americana]